MSIRPLAFVIAALVMAGPAPAEVKADYNAVVRDLQTMNKAEDRLTLVFWMPVEFWRVTLEASGKLSEKGIQDFVKALGPYTLVAVMDAHTGLAGAMTYDDADSIKASVTLEDTHGSVYRPVAPDDVDPGVKNLVQMMRPALANSLGPMGSHMEFLVFPGTSKDGEHFADVRKDGVLLVHVGAQTFRYRLPLGSFLPPAVDEKTGENFPGNYHYNPFTGTRLKTPPK